MKNIKRITTTAAFLIITAIAFTPQAMAQTAPPPNNGDTGNGGGVPVGGGAPIGDAIILLVTASLAYGLHKYKFPWQVKEEKIKGDIT